MSELIILLEARKRNGTRKILNDARVAGWCWNSEPRGNHRLLSYCISYASTAKPIGLTPAFHLLLSHGGGDCYELRLTATAPSLSPWLRTEAHLTSSLRNPRPPRRTSPLSIAPPTTKSGPFPVSLVPGKPCGSANWPPQHGSALLKKATRLCSTPKPPTTSSPRRAPPTPPSTTTPQLHRHGASHRTAMSTSTTRPRLPSGGPTRASSGCTASRSRAASGTTRARATP